MRRVATLDTDGVHMATYEHSSSSHTDNFPINHGDDINNQIQNDFEKIFNGIKVNNLGGVVNEGQEIFPGAGGNNVANDDVGDHFYLKEVLLWSLLACGIVVAILVCRCCWRRRRISSGGIIRLSQTAKQPASPPTVAVAPTNAVASIYHPATVPSPNTAGTFYRTTMSNPSSIGTPYSIATRMMNNESCSVVTSAVSFPAPPPSYNEAMVNPTIINNTRNHIQKV